MQLELRYRLQHAPSASAPPPHALLPCHRLGSYPSSGPASRTSVPHPMAPRRTTHSSGLLRSKRAASPRRVPSSATLRLVQSPRLAAAALVRAHAAPEQLRTALQPSHLNRCSYTPVFRFPVARARWSPLMVPPARREIGRAPGLSALIANPEAPHRTSSDHTPLQTSALQMRRPCSGCEACSDPHHLRS